MTQPAKIFQFPSQEPENAPKGPQVENGYTRIANELYEAVNNAQTCPVTLRQMRVIHSVIRRTYGFQKKFDRISDSQIAGDTGLSRQNANKAKKELLVFGVLVLDGSKIGLNKHVDQWNFDAKPEKNNLSQFRDSVSKAETKSVSKSGSHKRKKDNDMNTYVFIVDRRSANRPVDLSKLKFVSVGKPLNKKSALPACPQTDLLDLWAEIMPEKRQPVRSMWTKSQRAKNLSARWKQGFGIKNDQTGQYLYTDTASGLEWWGRFLRFLRKSEFLMRDDSRFFGLDWVAKAENFEKIMELKYHGGDA